jgi:hypothetical protein
VPNEAQAAVHAVAEAEARCQGSSPALVELRRAVDELIATIAVESGPPETASLPSVLRRAVAELAVDGVSRFELPADIPEILVIDRHGLVVRALRLFLSLAVHAAPHNRPLSLKLHIEAGRVEVRIEKTAPVVAQLAGYGRLIGTIAGRDSTSEQEATWLTLRRA